LEKNKNYNTMNRKYAVILFNLLVNLCCYAQKPVLLDDFGRIVLNTYLPDKSDMPTEAKKALETKLNQITTNYGMGGSNANSRFIITAVSNIGTKDIVPGPPQKIALNIELTLFIGDAIDNKKFTSSVLNLQGAGDNENKAFIDAIKSINPKNKNLQTFIEEGKNEIINYYATKCDFIKKEATELSSVGKYSQAIYNLSLVPDVCKDCYFECMSLTKNIFQQKIDAECSEKLSSAKSQWIASQNKDGASAAGNILSTIHPASRCQQQVAALYQEINSKLKENEKKEWEFKMKQYDDNVAKEKEQMRINDEKSKRDDQYRENQSAREKELENERINAYRQVATEYAKNQPKTITYNNIYWR
jgi:hypothetical protein